MTQEQARSIERLVEEQIAKWNRLRTKPRQENTKVRAVITVSRQSGTGGTTIAEKVAKSMQMDFLSSEIIKKVAESAQMSETVVTSLDEKDIALREDWLKMLLDAHHLWPDQYLRHLMDVVSTIGRHGNAVIVGRGANYILPPEDAFRVRLIASPKARITHVMSELGLSRQEAEKYVIQTESDRKAFILKYFHADVDDSAHYDIVIDTGRLGEEGAVEVITHAFDAWRKNVDRQS